MDKQIISLLMRAAENSQLKEQLKKNPKNTLEHECAISLPENTLVAVYENTDDLFFFVLPSVNQAKELYEQLPDDEKASSLYQKESDPLFRDRLLKNPKEVLTQECQFTFPAQCEIKIVESADHEMHLVIPTPDQSEELSNQELAHISGGMQQYNRVQAFGVNKAKKKP